GGRRAGRGGGGAPARREGRAPRGCPPRGAAPAAGRGRGGGGGRGRGAGGGRGGGGAGGGRPGPRAAAGGGQGGRRGRGRGRRARGQPGAGGYQARVRADGRRFGGVQRLPAAAQAQRGGDAGQGVARCHRVLERLPGAGHGQGGPGADEVGVGADGPPVGG